MYFAGSLKFRTDVQNLLNPELLQHGSQRGQFAIGVLPGCAQAKNHNHRLTISQRNTLLRFSHMGEHRHTLNRRRGLRHSFPSEPFHITAGVGNQQIACLSNSAHRLLLPLRVPEGGLPRHSGRKQFMKVDSNAKSTVRPHTSERIGKQRRRPVGRIPVTAQVNQDRRWLTPAESSAGIQ